MNETLNLNSLNNLISARTHSLSQSVMFLHRLIYRLISNLSKIAAHSCWSRDFCSKKLADCPTNTQGY